jgi:hypothetical protein
LITQNKPYNIVPQIVTDNKPSKVIKQNHWKSKFLQEKARKQESRNKEEKTPIQTKKGKI